MYICCVLDGNIHIFTATQWDGPCQKNDYLTQALSHQPLMAEVPVLFPTSPCGIFGEQSGTDTNLSPSTFGFPCQ